MEPSTLLQNVKWKYSEIKEWQSVEVRNFWSSPLEIKISNAHNVRNTGPISKIPTLLSSEAWDLSPYKILWILVMVRWKIPILLDHLKWNDPQSIYFTYAIASSALIQIKSSTYTIDINVTQMMVGKQWVQS